MLKKKGAGRRKKGKEEIGEKGGGRGYTRQVCNINITYLLRK